MLEHPPDDEVGLLVLVSAGDHGGGLAALARGPQLLVVPLGRLRDDPVGGRQDRLRGAVVLLERAHRHVREPRREVEDVADLGRAEAVDRLRVVAHHRHAGAVRSQPGHDPGLDDIGVLVLVDEHLVEAAAHLLARGLVRQQAVPEQQQVVVVQHVALGLAVHVRPEQRVEVVLVFAAVRERALENVLERLARVHAP